MLVLYFQNTSPNATKIIKDDNPRPIEERGGGLPIQRIFLGLFLADDEVVASDTEVTKVLVSQVGRGWPWLGIGQMLLILIHHITTPPDIDTDTSLSHLLATARITGGITNLPSGHSFFPLTFTHRLCNPGDFQ